MSARYVLSPSLSLALSPPETYDELLTSPSFPERNAAVRDDSQKGTTPNAIALRERHHVVRDGFSKEKIMLPGRPGRRGLHQTSNLERDFVPVYLL